MIKKIVHQINSSKSVLLVSHADPDGDSVGALLAMGLAVEASGKNVVFFNESSIPAVYRFLPGIDRIVSQLDDISGFDVAIVLDCSTLDRVGSIEADLRKFQPIINIDHHPTNTNFGHLNMIWPNACATAEIVYELTKKMGVCITKPIAMSIYTGILTDTGSFRFANTNENAFSICKEMVKYGVDPSFVAQHVYGPFSLNRLKLLNRALDSLEISNNGKLSIMALSQDMYDQTHTKPEDTDGFLNYARNIQDIKVAALIQEQSEEGGDNTQKPTVRQRPYHVSLRSNGTVDVGKIALSYGGGGHQGAAGFSITSSLKEIKSKLFKLSEIL